MSHVPPTTHPDDATDQRQPGLEVLQETFIRNVSHELRTPLSVLKGYAELLQAGELGALAPEQQEAMFVIVNRAEELQTIVTRVGVLLEMEAGMAAAHPMSLSSVAAQMTESLRARAERAGIVLRFVLPQGVSRMLGAEEHIQQALECLIDNAFKFTPRGGEVEVRLIEDCGGVCLSVSDTGIGIAAEDLADLFTPFHQVDSSHSRRYGGMGLGLTVVQKVVAAYQGQIEVTSTPGAGSCFTLKFPALTDTPASQAADSTVAKTRRILVVDDEEFVGLTLQEGLEKLSNCEVAVALNGAQALTMFAEQPFDLLITDYKMPDMNGVTLAARVRELYPKTGVIMITAYSNHLLREPFAAAAVQRVLNKPVRISEIRTAALETLSNGERQPEKGAEL